jgi:Cys-tRNA(Pro)/Cys-tRNA(Cys) deacylase
MVEKTLAMKILDGKRIPYESFEYSTDDRDATLIADQLGVPANEVFKTLVVIGQEKKSFLVMLPADKQLSLKKFAKVVGIKKVKMAGHDEAEKLTGLKVGGISALMLINRGFSMYADQSVLNHERIFVSGGKRGLQIALAGKDLVAATGARIAEVAN